MQKYKKRPVDGRSQISCSLLKREGVLRKLSNKLGVDLTPHGFLALCTFLGNDYILRVRNNGIPASLKLTADFMGMREGEEVEFFKKFEVDEKGKKRKWNEKGGEVQDYQRHFNHSANLFKYAPVLRRAQTTLCRCAP